MKSSSLSLRFTSFLMLAMSLSPLAPGNPDTKAPPAKTGKAVSVEAPVIMLEPYTFEETPPPLCFGVSLSIWRDGNTGRVTAMYIDKVKSGSSAEEHGFGPRTRIYRINDQPVEEMIASFNGDTELNRIFINRKIGSRITVEAVTEGSTEPKTVTLVEKLNMSVEVNVWETVSRPIQIN